MLSEEGKIDNSKNTACGFVGHIKILGPLVLKCPNFFFINFVAVVHTQKKVGFEEKYIKI